MGKCTRITFSNEYSVAHPALSRRENLVFCIRHARYQGFIRSFKVSINPNDTYGTPENLGLPINTESRETFRISHQIIRCILPVMDILDLRFRCVVMDLSKNSRQYQNLGTPINSTQDDFSFVIDAENKKRICDPIERVD
jgi:hypothetical protein